MTAGRLADLGALAAPFRPSLLEQDDVGRLVRSATASVGRPDLPPVADELLVPGTATRVAAHAALHRVEGCVHEAVRHVPGVDPALVGALGAARTAAVRQHLQTMRAVRAIDDVLGEAGIRWHVMKGPVLASHLYGDAGLRSSIDLDVLVPQEHFARAVRLLEDAGCVHLFRNWAFIRGSEAGELALGLHGVTIDAHWHLMFGAYNRRWFGLDPAPLLERLRTVAVGGRAVPTFDPADTLLHLALHGAHSGGDRLVWLKDIERSLTVEAPDLDEVVRRARDLRCHLPVGLALGRAGRVMAAPVPDGLVEALIGRSLARADRLATRLFPVERTIDGGTVATFLGRCLMGSRRATVSRLAGTAVHRLRVQRDPDRHLDEHDPRRRHSPLRPVGGEADKDAFLDWVSSA